MDLDIDTGHTYAFVTIYLKKTQVMYLVSPNNVQHKCMMPCVV